ncbi:hypothetical protein Pcinc_027869 [Petrolisthes cinctipes]|uniref:Myotubularin phosphatase domain-containing protein n=1 Tax=Petrolisthes cinctipes TaxID=88211 RepID=A0AAE1F4S3_PETCI|nr:hypothetical protein Pcinc_027869 [Petrolisthes cinctipes]
MYVMLFHHSYSSQFGTFLGNNDGERRALGCHERTTSLWSYVNRPEMLPRYLNPMYEPNQRVIWPSVAPMSLQLWSAVYLAWVVEQGAVEAAWGVGRELRERDASLRSKVARLRRQLQDLEREALEAGILSVPSPTEVEFARLSVAKARTMSVHPPPKRKEIYKYSAPWTLYSMNWSVRPDKRFRLAVGSFVEEYNNKVQIVQLDEDTSEFVVRSTFDHPYPTTKIMWIPDSKGIYPDLLATSGDYLRVWQQGADGDTRMACLLNNVR